MGWLMLFNDTWSQEGYSVSCTRREMERGRGHGEMEMGRRERGGDGEAAVRRERLGGGKGWLVDVVQ